jgi:cholesterol oxidase
LILAGGTVGTAKLLLGSRAGLPHLSGEVGRHIAFNGSVKVAGLLPDHFPDADMFAGRSHPGMISYEFLASHGLTISAGKPLPIQAVAAARLRLDGDGAKAPHWGAPHLELMRQYRHRMMVLVAFGMTPPLGSIAVDDGGTLSVNLDLTDDLRRYYTETERLLCSILERNGCRLVETEFVNGEGRPHPGLFFSTAHQVGSCRMANTRSSGVVDALGRVFGYPGLYVADGSAIPTSLAVNTSLTILANAERISAGILAGYTIGRSRIAAMR